MSLPPLSDQILRSVLVHGLGYESHFTPTSVGPQHLLERTGSGERLPVLFFHGFGASALNYVPILSRMRRGVRHLWLPDLPCHGLSATPADGLSQATLTAGLEEGLPPHVSQPHLVVGNSLGGAVAVRYALRNPELVRGLVLLSPAGAPLDEAELAELQAIFAIDSHRDAVAFVDRLRSRPSWTAHLLAPDIRRRLSNPNLQAWIGALTDEVFLTADQLRQLTCPVLLLWGRDERILPETTLAFYQAHTPQLTVERPAGWGHSAVLDAPASVANRILGFSDSL